MGLEKQSSTTVHSYGYGTELLQRDGETMQYDGHGDTRTVTNNSQTVTATGNYEAYGTLVGGTGSSSTPYQYGGTSGYRTDGDADLIYIAARWYDPIIGRWISADTELGDPTVPADRNRYTYSTSDPVSYVDPNGHSRRGAIGGALIAITLVTAVILVGIVLASPVGIAVGVGSYILWGAVGGALGDTFTPDPDPIRGLKIGGGIGALAALSATAPPTGFPVLLR